MKRMWNILKWTLISLTAFVLVGFIASEATIAIYRSQLSESALHDYETVNVDGIDIAYRSLVDEGDETLIIVHGFLGSSYEYVDLFDGVDVEAFNTRVIAIDMPGFGMSDKPEDYVYTNDTHAQTLLAAIEALGIESFSLLGHSLGGEVAQRMVAASSDVEKLFLLDPVGPNMETDPVTIPRFFYTVFFKNYWLQRLGFNSAPAEPLEKDVFRPAMIQNHGIPSRILQKFSEDVDDNFPVDFASEISIPIYIAYGDQDTWTPPGLLDDYLELYPQAEGSIIENSGHLPYLDQPENTRVLIENFINNE